MSWAPPAVQAGYFHPGEACRVRNAEALGAPAHPLKAGNQVLNLEEPGGALHVLEVHWAPSVDGFTRIRLSPRRGEGILLYDWVLRGGSSSFRSTGFRLDDCAPTLDQGPAISCTLSRDPVQPRAEAHFWLQRGPGGQQGTLWRLECGDFG